MSTRWWTVVVVAVVAAVVAIAAITVFANTETSVVVEFDGEVGDAPGEPGVYRYETTGFETVDAFGGGRHDYPQTTFVVIEDGDCGPIVRWHALEERSDRRLHCGPDLALTGFEEHHEWFGVSDDSVATCEPMPIFPPGDGSAWQATCRRGDTVITLAGDVVGTEVVVVGGESVEVIHVRIEERTSGRTAGTRTTDIWRLPGTVLAVRTQVVDRSTTESPIGDIHYTEEYTLILRSLLPTR